MTPALTLILTLVGLGVAFVVYFLPSVIASARGHHQQIDREIQAMDAAMYWIGRIEGAGILLGLQATSGPPSGPPRATEVGAVAERIAKRDGS